MQFYRGKETYFEIEYIIYTDICLELHEETLIEVLLCNSSSICLLII